MVTETVVKKLLYVDDFALNVCNIEVILSQMDKFWRPDMILTELLTQNKLRQCSSLPLSNHTVR